MQIYLVGGIIRDRLLNVESDDYDYVMVLEDTDMSVEDGFEIMNVETLLLMRWLRIWMVI